MRPVDIYEVEGLNPPDPKLPNPDMMLELMNLTQNKAKPPKNDTVSNNDGPVWSPQLSEERTLELLGKWVERTISAKKDDVTNKMYSWMLLNSFIQKCDAMLIWRSSDDGVLKRLVQNVAFYSRENAVHSGQIIRTVVNRLANDDVGYDIVRTFLQSIPIGNIDRQDTLDTIFGGAFRELFFKAGDSRYVLSDAFPPEWQVTNANLKSSNKMSKLTSTIYLNWIRDLQKYAQEINERAAQEVTEFIFPEVEVMLFSRFVLLWINAWHLQTSHPEEMQYELDRWKLFGHLSRVSTEWTPIDGTDQEIDNRFLEIMKRSEEATIELVKKLGWFPNDKSSLEALSKNLIKAIDSFTWQPEHKKTWQRFAEMLPQLASEQNDK